MDVGMFEPDAAELDQILGLQPDRQPAPVERLVAEIADAEAGHLQPVLVGVERAERFAEHLADAVAAVGTWLHVIVDLAMARIKTDRMVRRSEDNALDALATGGLKEVVAADDVGLQDVVPRPFDRIAAEMDDAIHALAQRLDLGEVGKIGR